MTNPIRRISIFLAALFLITSCQDDPILQPVENGVPVITPKSKAYITAIQINSYPALDPSGNLWDTPDSAIADTFGLPDIFFNITTPGPDVAVLWSQQSHFSNVQPTDTLPFFLLDQFEVVPFGSNIDLNIYDFELPDSTLMGTINFFVGEYPDPQNPYPDYITGEVNGYSVTIGLRYEE